MLPLRWDFQSQVQLLAITSTLLLAFTLNPPFRLPLGATKVRCPSGRVRRTAELMVGQRYVVETLAKLVKHRLPLYYGHGAQVQSVNP